MSKFLDAIECEMTGRRFAEKPRMLSVESEVCPYPYDYARAELCEYRVRLVYGSLVVCKPDAVAQAKRNILDSLKDEIYGEFKQKLYALERASFDMDEHKIQTLIGDLLTEIN